MEKGLIKRITERKNKLEFIKKELKKKFIGIDDVINKIVDNISLWYLMPEIQFRPLIVSLWGITGVGKTDLVRTLVKLLEYTDKFIEIQMDIKNDYSRDIEQYLESSGVDINEPAILLLDEIQRFRTIDEMGGTIENKSFNDIWMLLSDGKFQNNSQRKREIMEHMLDEMYWLDRGDNEGELEVSKTDVSVEKTEGSSSEPEKPKKPKNYKYKTSFWTANRFKKMLNLKISIEEIMAMTIEERMSIMENSLKSNNINEGKSYEKLLIFISGNLDEAFRMADRVEDSESDADIMHELSKRINIIHIKNALAYRFKPEQIARFGNNHIIYPCLDKKTYQTIIKMNCQEILDRVEKQHQIKFNLSDTIYDTIYRNGVFPAQGVRPTISTLFNVLGSNLPYFIYHALINNQKIVNLDYENKTLFTEINNKKIVKDIVLDIDDVCNSKSIDEVMLIIVHELGHALIYALLFNTPPKQINTNSSGLSKGFVVNHHSIDNKTFIKNSIAIYLAGIVAEEMVFGEEFKSNGAASDIMQATESAAHYVRSFGMDKTISRIIKKETKYDGELNYDVDKTNDIIEGLLVTEKKRARDLLNKNINVYKLLVEAAIKGKGISINKFLEICNKNGMELVQKEINDKLIYSYEDKLNNFLIKLK